MRYLSSDVSGTIASIEALIGEPGQMSLVFRDSSRDPLRIGETNWTAVVGNVVWMNWDSTWMGPAGGPEIPNLVSLTHELAHALDGLQDGIIPADQATRENPAIAVENRMRLAFYWKVPTWLGLWPLRPPF
jgi:hypothetical protein